MTFNTQRCLNYIERKTDYKIMADAIKNCGADIVGLNEMCGKGESPGYEDQTAILSELTGLKNYYFAKAIDVCGANPYGNAFLSKYAIVSAETIPIPDPVPNPKNQNYESRCILKAKLENSFTVLAVHFGLNEDEQINAVETVLKNIENEKCILMGDFNVTPDSEILNPIREKMRDTAECFKEPRLSFPSDKPQMKIDYIFVTPDINVIEADIPTIIASDHRPHTATIEL